MLVDLVTLIGNKMNFKLKNKNNYTFENLNLPVLSYSDFKHYLKIFKNRETFCQILYPEEKYILESKCMQSFFNSKNNLFNLQLVSLTMLTYLFGYKIFLSYFDKFSQYRSHKLSFLISCWMISYFFLSRFKLFYFDKIDIRSRLGLFIWFDFHTKNHKIDYESINYLNELIEKSNQCCGNIPIDNLRNLIYYYELHLHYYKIYLAKEIYLRNLDENDNNNKILKEILKLNQSREEISKFNQFKIFWIEEKINSFLQQENRHSLKFFDVNFEKMMQWENIEEKNCTLLAGNNNHEKNFKVNYNLTEKERKAMVFNTIKREKLFNYIVKRVNEMN